MRTVLWVEDNPDILALATFVGRNYGWVVIEETQGIRAVDRYRQVQPDAIVIDLKLPDPGHQIYSGLDVSQEIRKTDKTTPIIIATGADAVVAKSAASWAEANWTFIKPLDMDKVFERLDKLVGVVHKTAELIAPRAKHNFPMIAFAVLFATIVGGLLFGYHLQEVFNARHEQEMIDLCRDEDRRFLDLQHQLEREQDAKLADLTARVGQLNGDVGTQRMYIELFRETLATHGLLNNSKK